MSTYQDLPLSITLVLSVGVYTSLLVIILSVFLAISPRNLILFIQFFLLYIVLRNKRGHDHWDCMVVEFPTTCAISAYHH